MIDGDTHSEFSGNQRSRHQMTWSKLELSHFILVLMTKYEPILHYALFGLGSGRMALIYLRCVHLKLIYDQYLANTNV